MDSSHGLPSLLMPLQPVNLQPGSLRVTPAVFSDGTALVQFVNGEPFGLGCGICRTALMLHREASMLRGSPHALQLCIVRTHDPA